MSSYNAGATFTRHFGKIEFAGCARETKAHIHTHGGPPRRQQHSASSVDDFAQDEREREGI